MRKAFYTFFLLLYSVLAFSQKPFIEPAGPTGFCPGASITLTIKNASPGATFQWFRGNDLLAGVTSSNYVANAEGTYTAVLTANNKADTLDSVTVKAFTAPVANFSFDNNNTCSGTAVKFTPSATSGTPPYKYEWDFGDNSTSTAASPTHQFFSFGCGTGTFEVKLKVTDANGCSNNISKQISVKQVPEINMRDMKNPFSQFNNCSLSPSTGNPDFTVQLGFNTPSPACATTYSVDWGDNAAETGLTAASFPLTHKYTQLGIFDLVVSVIGTDGCQYSKTYKVINQSNPAVGISAPGSTTGCAPTGFWFKLKGYEPNSPGTTYTWSFGDGSPDTTWTMPISVDSIFHLYKETSCTMVNGQFVVKVTATNGCKSTTATVDNITIYGKPKAGFSPPQSACINRAVLFSNTTVGGYNQGTCDRTTLYSWNFGDPASSQNTSTQENPTHVYSATGTYSVTLIAIGSCGSDTVRKTVCVVAQPTAAFTLDTTQGCAPFIVKATNTSSTLAECAEASYQWQVTYSPASCSSGAGWSFLNSTSTSIDPTFSFTNPGRYTITLSVTNACATVSTSKEILVKAPPKVSLAAVSNSCGPITFRPSATVANCGTGNLIYSWVIDNATPITSQDPGNITFSLSAQHTISLTVTNECGSATDTRTFFVNPLPELIVRLISFCAPGKQQALSVFKARRLVPPIAGSMTILPLVLQPVEMAVIFHPLQQLTIQKTLSQPL